MFARLLSPRAFGIAAATATAATAGAAAFALAPTAALTVADPAPQAGVLRPDAWAPFTVAANKKLNHNTFQLTLALADPAAKAGAVMPAASCLLARLPVGTDGKNVIRPYTPTSAPDDAGALDLVIKAYPDGKLTPHLAKLKPGDTLDMKGPIPKLSFAAPNTYDHVAMLAGGTGITPMLQVLHACLANPADATRFTVLYGSLTPRDIICKDELDRLAAAHPGRVAVHYTVDSAGGFLSRWGGRVGRIDKDWLAATLPAPGAGGNNVVLVCGPPPMMAALSGPKAKDKSQGELAGALKELGYTEKDVFKF